MAYDSDAASEADGLKGIAGCWDAIHVLDVNDEVNDKGRASATTYKLTSTIMLWMETDKDTTGLMNLGGNMTRQVWPRLRHVVSPLPYPHTAHVFFGLVCSTSLPQGPLATAPTISRTSVPSLRMQKSKCEAH